MDFNKLRNDLKNRYFSTWEYFSNGFNALKVFSKKHPILLFFHFLFSFFLGVVVIFQGAEIMVVMDKIVKKYGSTKINSNEFVKSKEFNELTSEVMLFILCFIIVYLIIRFISAVIRKKMGLEVEERENEFSIVETIVKFLTITFVNIVLQVFLIILGIIITVFTRSTLSFLILWIILQLNLLYFEQAYYLRKINIIEAFKYNFYISKGNRIRMLTVLLTIFTVFVGINYFLGWLFEATIKNQVTLMTVNAIFGGIAGLLYTVLGTMVSNLVYLNLEYIDFNNS